jgi:hypothetical protein
MRTICFPLAFLFLLSGCNAQGDSTGDGQMLGDVVQVEMAFPELSFQRPVGVYAPPDGSGRLFVLEQAGVIRVFSAGAGASEAPVFLDIRARVRDSGNEEGLLGLAFHPDFTSNGRFYLDYTASNPRRTVISQWSVDAEDPNQADPESESVILEVEQPYSNHNGGQIAFGPDGFASALTLSRAISGQETWGRTGSRKSIWWNPVAITAGMSWRGAPASNLRRDATRRASSYRWPSIATSWAIPSQGVSYTGVPRFRLSKAATSTATSAAGGSGA